MSEAGGWVCGCGCPMYWERRKGNVGDLKDDMSKAVCLKDEEREERNLESGVVPGWLNYIRLWRKMSGSSFFLQVHTKFHRPVTLAFSLVEWLLADGCAENGWKVGQRGQREESRVNKRKLRKKV